MLKIILICLLSIAASAADFNVAVSWNAPANQPDAMLYRLKVGTQPGVYTQTVEHRPDAYVSGAELTKVLTLAETPGAYYYVVAVTVNTSGIESEPTPVLVFEAVPKAQRKAPSPPVGPPRINNSVEVSLQESLDLKSWATVATKTYTDFTPSRYWRTMVTMK